MGIINLDLANANANLASVNVVEKGPWELSPT